MTEDLRLPPDHRLLVTGGLFPRADERTLTHDELQSVQLIDANGCHEVERFRGWGERGVIALVTVQGALWVSTGQDLWRVDLNGGQVQCDVGPLVDVHELAAFNGRLWVPNTGRDEVLALDPTDGAVHECIDLTAHRLGDPVQELVRDTFHCNQALLTHTGELAVLVHHVTGQQVRLSQKIKRQGDGGVLVLDADLRRLDLGLRGPHSVRRWRDGYLACDSGAATVNEYGPDFRLRRRLAVAGWGRGLAVHGDVAWLGVSTIRKRYANMGRHAVPNQVQVLDLASWTTGGSIMVPGVEQLNSVELVHQDVAAAISDL